MSEVERCQAEPGERPHEWIEQTPVQANSTATPWSERFSPSCTSLTPSVPPQGVGQGLGLLGVTGLARPRRRARARTTDISSKAASLPSAEQGDAVRHLLDLAHDVTGEQDTVRPSAATSRGHPGELPLEEGV